VDETSPWRLFDANGQLLATLWVTDSDMPWLHARVEAPPEFEKIRHLFEAELHLLDRVDEDPMAYERAYQAVEDAVRLINPAGSSVPEFLIHVDGSAAWWRWSDEPFD
jgi:hypothetical protein